MICNLCPRNCGVDRSQTKGFCQCDEQIKIAHYGRFDYEEPLISGLEGSGAIFFSGCSLKCVYCQNYEISALNKGKTVSVNGLVEIIKELEQIGVHNINFVTPTHYSSQIVDALKIYKPKIPVIYNTHGYEKIEIIEQLANYVDIFLPDFKYICDETSQKYSNVNDYFQVATKAIKRMIELKPNIISGGVMKQGVIIRHLILPLQSNSSNNILIYIKEHYPNTLVSLMAQYVPYGKAKDFPEINRKITKREYDKVVSKYLELGLDGFIQSRSSASEDYIPKFKFV